MGSRVAFWVVLGSLFTPLGARADWEGRGVGSPVNVTVEVDGQKVPLYAAPDGTGRWYLEARESAHYAIALVNRSYARLGVVLNVDGLNAITGQRDDGQGRMYVLEPSETTRVQGWRTSLNDVHRFTFVDESRSYATRTGQANGKMGWIEVTVFRERTPEAVNLGSLGDNERLPSGRAGAAPKDAPRSSSSYPGTGWGPRVDDPAVLVRFDPEATPSEQITLRYEYRTALVKLGVLPTAPFWGRLQEREQGGFAKPPLW
jgi:hypothetical protein